ncbi:hypothetical protein GCM10007907_08550 [Chitinimonas prasina]|uniref:Molecular chaperone GroEL n=1 Tax=Chitinimonas prasina TaxID=1434937 RepID=A0ABQ5YAT9_9NEIS|nr:DUF6463 family protein [Chitinimonas prasina]GLR12065.1 hypothetical protein GCM10007907_08550 [Chitinimonas prasina]
MKQWIGRWLIGVAVIHTVFGVVVFGKELLGIVQRGVFDTVGTDPMTGAVVWFVLFGAVLFICGQAVSRLEASSPAGLPKGMGWSLLALGVLGVVLMPASGFWLVFPPAIAMLVKRGGAKPALV